MGEREERSSGGPRGCDHDGGRDQGLHRDVGVVTTIWQETSPVEKEYEYVRDRGRLVVWLVRVQLGDVGFLEGECLWLFLNKCLALA